MKMTTKWAAAMVVVAFLVSCESDEAPDSDVTTTIVASTEDGSASASSQGASSDSSATAPPVTAPVTVAATTDPPVTSPPATTPVTTATTSPEPAPADAGATLVISAGAESMTGTGGTCSVIDGYTYVFVGEVGGIGGSLSWQTDDPSAGQFLAWQHGASAGTSYISTHGLDQVGIEIAFGDGATSGEFTGWYYVIEPQEFRQFSGSFNCTGG